MITPNIQILMPMAGQAERFKTAGILTPKPLIEVDGIPMFKRALSGLSGSRTPLRFFGVIREEQDSEFQLGKLLRTHCPEMKIITIVQSRSPVETCLGAQSQLESKHPVLVLDCDFEFESKEFISAISDPDSLKTRKVDGVGLWFESDSSRFSYVELDSGNVRRFAEKTVISRNALAGAYYFRVAGDFLDSCRRVLSRPVDPRLREHYISEVCQDFLGLGRTFTAVPTTRYRSFGTPEELPKT